MINLPLGRCPEKDRVAICYIGRCPMLMLKGLRPSLLQNDTITYNNCCGEKPQRGESNSNGQRPLNGGTSTPDSPVGVTA